MYAGAILLLLATPLALGSWWGLILVIPAIGGIAWRLIDEERFSCATLPATTRTAMRRRIGSCPWCGE